MIKKKMELDEVFRGTRRDSLKKAIAKSHVVSIRVTENDKTDMQAMAKSLDLTVTDYLTNLHCFARRKLEDQR